MRGYDFNRPMISVESMDKYVAIDKDTAKRFGKIVKATDLTNVEYKTRFGRLRDEQRMKNPPSCGRYFPGFLVVRNLGRKNQYETWMPEVVFEELYKKIE